MRAPADGWLLKSGGLRAAAGGSRAVGPAWSAPAARKLTAEGRPSALSAQYPMRPPRPGFPGRGRSLPHPGRGQTNSGLESEDIIMIKIAPSILSADFVNLERDIKKVASADYLHVDVMDGCFVPNLTIGIPVVKSIRKCTDMFLDVHLMIDKPVRYIEDFAKAGADLLSVHLEADHPTRIAEALKVMGECGVKKAVALRPITAPSAVLPYLEGLDMVLVMTVEPGFGGQAFMESQLDTIRQVRAIIDRYNPACELEVDGVFDGEDILIPGIMEHVERAGVHSGDSIAVYPPINLEEKHRELILKHTKNMAKHLNVIGLINAQYILYNDDIYVIEVNPRSSRTIPYISKVTGVPIIDLATKVMLGEKLKDLGYGTGLYREASYFAVKAPVFSFEKLTDVDTGLGPEMKSTGEVLGLAETYPQALLKAFKGAGLKVPKRGSRIIVTVKDEDKAEMVGIARGFEEMGVEIYATSGTCDALTEAGIQCKRVNRVSQAHPNILDMIQSGTVDLIINTPTKGRKQDSDGFKIRRSAVEHSVACVTAIDTARAVLTVREQSRSEDLTPIDITKI